MTLLVYVPIAYRFPWYSFSSDLLKFNARISVNFFALPVLLLACRHNLEDPKSDSELKEVGRKLKHFSLTITVILAALAVF